MITKKVIFVIIGSASRNSACMKLAEHLRDMSQGSYLFKIYDDLKSLPHFDPELSVSNPPEQIISLRNEIEKADGVLIISPEYVFSIPSGLKNLIEWTVSTTVFSDKPCGLITAATSGIKAHEELKLIMKTLTANFIDATTLLIQGVKGKINDEGNILDQQTSKEVDIFFASFSTLLERG